MKPKAQRLVLVSAALVAMVAAALLAMIGLKNQAGFFLTPTDIAAGKAEEGKAARLGGRVEKGSVHREADGVTIHFMLTDGQTETSVIYRGIVPDLFREGSGAVAEGRLQGGTFVAHQILAKHDERYMPPEPGNLAADQQTAKTVIKKMRWIPDQVGDHEPRRSS